VEVAANDGYLLQFVREAGVPCYGIEPTASTAAVARAKGIEIIEEFFGTLVARNLAETKGFADLIVANNVLAHVPDINDFVAGFRELLSPDGVATFEFPHVLKLIEGCQFDTIYHEHYSYLSLSAVKHIFERQGLDIFDVDEIETHGGSLRIYCCRQDNSKKCIDPRVEQMIERERDAGLLDLRYYSSLGRRAEIVKLELLAFLVDQKRKGIAVAAYGAAAKGNTLLNFTGVKRDLLPFVCDAAPSKQGRFLPGSHVPILPPSAIKERRPEFILILPWNLRKEIVEDLHYVRDWGAKFVLALPQLEVI
jgi:SAM-dependent methyltransferase